MFICLFIVFNNNKFNHFLYLLTDDLIEKILDNVINDINNIKNANFMRINNIY